jgi:hypothetical protein
VNEKEANHPVNPMDRTANWCSHGGWFTLALFKSLFLTERPQVNQEPPLDACSYSVVDEPQLS